MRQWASLGLALLCPATLAATVAENWVKLSQDRDGEYFYDPASITDDGDRRQISVRALLTASGGEPARTMIVRQEMDCREQSNALLSAWQIGADGKPIRPLTIRPDLVTHQPLFAGSNDEPLYRLLCPKGAALPPFKGPTLQILPTDK